MQYSTKLSPIAEERLSDPLLRATATSKVSLGVPANTARGRGECGCISASCGLVLAEDFGVIRRHAFVEQLGFSVD